MVSQTIVGALIPRVWDALMRRVTGQRQRRRVLQSLLRDVEHDRDALNDFLYQVELGTGSGHVISQAAGLDIWYDILLSTRDLPDLLAKREADAVVALRHSFPPVRDIDAVLRTLLKHYDRLPRYQQELRDEFARGEGRDLLRDYLVWEDADRYTRRDQVQQWEERQRLARRWDALKVTSPVGQKRVACIRGIVEAREQCEAIMRMVTDELALQPSTEMRPDARGLV